jgi:hypothetical protein
MTNREVRTVEVKPPSRSRESFAVAMIAASIAMCAIYSIRIRTGAAGLPGNGATRSVDSLPFQTTFQELAGPEQRIVRELLEGFTEAKRLRAETRAWPAPEKLAADQIPPFAQDVLDKMGYRWTLRQVRLVVNYVGTATAPGSPDFLLMIQEPEPVGAYFPQPAEVDDEEHQLLPDGKLLHVTYWMRPASGVPAAIIASPEIEHWTQIRVGAKGTFK